MSATKCHNHYCYASVDPTDKYCADHDPQSPYPEIRMRQYKHGSSDDPKIDIHSLSSDTALKCLSEIQFLASSIERTSIYINPLCDRILDGDNINEITEMITYLGKLRWLRYREILLKYKDRLTPININRIALDCKVSYHIGPNMHHHENPNEEEILIFLIDNFHTNLSNKILCEIANTTVAFGKVALFKRLVSLGRNLEVILPESLVFCVNRLNSIKCSQMYGIKCMAIFNICYKVIKEKNIHSVIDYIKNNSNMWTEFPKDSIVAKMIIDLITHFGCNLLVIYPTHKLALPKL